MLSYPSCQSSGYELVSEHMSTEPIRVLSGVGVVQTWRPIREATVGFLNMAPADVSEFISLEKNRRVFTRLSTDFSSYCKSDWLKIDERFVQSPAKYSINVPTIFQTVSSSTCRDGSVRQTSQFDFWNNPVTESHCVSEFCCPDYTLITSDTNVCSEGHICVFRL